MYSMKDIHFVLSILLCSLGLVVAVPTWEGTTGRGSIGSLVPGASYIHAMGPGAYGGTANHLALHNPGEIGNLTIVENEKAPPMFYIGKNQLWLQFNETAIYPVNVHNTTGTHVLPMQLVLGKKREGITFGTWKWQSTMMFYDAPGKRTNDGLFYNCVTLSGRNNVFMTLTPVPSPPGCSMITLHSFADIRLKAQH